MFGLEGWDRTTWGKECHVLWHTVCCDITVYGLVYVIVEFNIFYYTIVLHVWVNIIVVMWKVLKEDLERWNKINN